LWAGDAFHLGVTATPIRRDGKGFDHIYQRMILGDDVKTLVENGWLSRPIVYAPPIEGAMDFSAVPMTAGDYNQAVIDQIMNRPKIMGDAVKHYQRLLPHSPPTIAFVVSVDAGKKLAAEFIAHGIPAAAIDGSMDDDQRTDLIKRFARGEIKILISCDLISEGFDLAAIADMDIAIAAAIFLRPTKSEGLYIQQAGRALRPATGKGETLIIDHVGNTLEHGAIDEHREWSLYGREKRSKRVKGETLATCKKCYAVYPPQPSCPACGFVDKPASGNMPREIEKVEGELVPLNTAKAAEFRKKARGLVGVQVRKLERA
jgi:superfamily II DNA or RNA helicase